MKKRGFTLIELLVVIAIIGLLSAVILASMSGARSKGRDTKRIADIKQLSLALQLYYDQNSSYPSTPGTVCSDTTVCPTLAALPDANYISVLPNDPTSGHYYYYQPVTFDSGSHTYSTCSSSCSGYVLVTQLENDTSSLNGYTGSPSLTFSFNSGSYNCSETGSPNFIYCTTP